MFDPKGAWVTRRLFLGAAAAGGCAASVARASGRVTFESSDRQLTEGFNWAKGQALKYVFTGDPVGDWYEAALPKREAFCMRDVAHQALGAQVLGLSAVTKNMLRKFAQGIAASRDWCSFWEIDKHDRPAPVDYKDDKDFWYCLPANFDVLHCCYRQFLWTGDQSYLKDPVFQNFYDRTVSEYVKTWDKDNDGLLESRREYGRRGIGSYSEDVKLRPRIVADLLSVHCSAYIAYARMQRLKGNRQSAERFEKLALQLRSLYNERWWSDELGRYQAAILQDGTFYSGFIHEAYIFPLYVEPMPEGGKKLEAALSHLAASSRSVRFGVETRSHLPETFYKWGLNDEGYRTLGELTSPSLKGREYPEVSFAAVGAMAAGTMGIAPDASSRVVSTMPRLTKETSWAAMKLVPVLDNEISVRHGGTTETRFTNESGPAIRWKATFPVRAGKLLVDGAAAKAQEEQDLRQQYSTSVVLKVNPGQTRTVRVA